MFSSLKVRNFRIYWLGMFISLIGTWIQSTAQTWLVFRLTNSVFLLGIMGFLTTLPMFLLSLFAGVAADRMNKKNILLFTQSAFMILAFLLAGLTQAKLITTWHIMFIALLNGAVMAFDAPTRQAVVLELVGREHLLNAVALNSAAFNSSRVIGPALAGIFIAVIGMSGCFYINAVSFLAVILALLAIRFNNGIKKNMKNLLMHDLAEGLTFIRRNPVILPLVLIVGITSLFGVSYGILMPIFADEILKVGVKGLGMLMSAAGLGALVAALVLARAGKLKYKGRYLIFSCFIFSGALITFALSRNYLLSLLALVLTGWSSVTAISLINTVLQESTPDEFRGRAMSVFMLTFAGFMPFGNLIAGSLSHIWGVSLTVVACGLTCAAFFMAINILYPGIKRI